MRNKLWNSTRYSPGDSKSQTTTYLFYHTQVKSFVYSYEANICNYYQFALILAFICSWATFFIVQCTNFAELQRGPWVQYMQKKARFLYKLNYHLVIRSITHFCHIAKTVTKCTCIRLIVQINIIYVRLGWVVLRIYVAFRLFQSYCDFEARDLPYHEAITRVQTPGPLFRKPKV